MTDSDSTIQSKSPHGKVVFTLVRHGQADWCNGDNGRAIDDPGLTAFGHLQAQRTAEALAGRQFDLLLVSPLARTQQTAAPIAEALGMPAETAEWLREIYVPMNGRTESDMRAYFHATQSRSVAEWWNGWDGGETYRDFRSRVTMGLDDFLRTRLHGQSSVHENVRFWHFPRGGRQRILIVGHGGTCAVIISHLLDLPPVPWEWERFHTHLAGISTVQTMLISHGQIWSLANFSRTDHLAQLTPQKGLLE